MNSRRKIILMGVKELFIGSAIAAMNGQPQLKRGPHKEMDVKDVAIQKENEKHMKMTQKIGFSL